jgi:zinc and cadmium transporter
MAMVLLWILGATLLDSLVALVGAFSLKISEARFKRLSFVLVSFAAGTLLAGAFFHLIPETMKSLSVLNAFILVMVGFALFYLLERVLRWHHCHDAECSVHPMSYLVLLGDAVHNFIDGLIIAASFLVDLPFGVLTTMLVLSHELPQELANFGVLVHSGIARKKALLYSLLAQSTSVVGGITGFFLGSLEMFVVFVLPAAAGGFIYVAASDLIPELHKEVELTKSLVSFLLFLLGVVVLLGLKLVLG